MLLLVLFCVNVARSQYALPRNAVVQRDSRGFVTSIRFDGNSDKQRQTIDGDTIEAIAKYPHLKSLSLFGTSVDDEDIARLASLKKLQMIDLSFTDVTGEGMSHFTKMPALVWIRLDGCKVGDTDLKVLADMPELAMLHLARTNVTDKGLKYIRGINLVLLDLQSCDISDDGLRSLGDFPRLRNLWLSKTIRHGEGDRSRLTDDCIDYLLTLDSLLDLQIADSRLTEAGIKRLRDGLPKAKIDVTRRGVTYLSSKKTEQ
jgi:hypothetical protein